MGRSIFSGMYAHISEHKISPKRKRRAVAGSGSGGAAGKSTRQGGGSKRGAQTYMHAVTDAHAALINGTGNNHPLLEIAKKSGADVQFDSNPSPVQGMKIFIIRGDASQIEAAVRLIGQETGAQETISEQAQAFWLRWAEDAFPDLDSRTYFLPPVYFNRVPMTRESAAGQEVLVFESAHGQAGTGQSNQLARVPPTSSHSAVPLRLPPVQDCEMRDDAAMQRVLFCLQKMSEQTGDVLFGLSQLQFGEYLGEPCYAAAAAQLPESASLPPVHSQNWKRGDFDILLIHRRYGFVVCEVKSVGHNVQKLNMSQSDLNNSVINKLKHAASQLDKAEAMLSHLVSDVVVGMNLSKTIAVPNLTARQVQQAISGDPQLTRDLCRCLGAANPADITGLCLCSDQMSDPKTPWEVSENVLRELGSWWQRRVAVSGPDAHMTCDVYKKLVARFCGPATTVTVPCIFPPRLCIKTFGQAVALTGEFYAAQIILFPAQVNLLNMAPPTVFVTGPPGTGKTVVLLLMAAEWLRSGNDVYIVSTWYISRTACIMLYHLLQQTVNAQLMGATTPGRPRLLHYDLDKRKEVDKAVTDLSQAARGESLYVIADEVGPENKSHFQSLCDELLAQVPRLHFWAACCYHGDAPAGWRVEYLTKPLRSPPAVVREVEQDVEITEVRDVQAYSQRGVPDHTDGPPVRLLCHRGRAHSEEDEIESCVACGREVAKFLRSLRVGFQATIKTRTATKRASTSDDDTAPPCLRWKDVLIVYWGNPAVDSGLVKGLTEGGIPAQLMQDADTEDVATARSDVVWVARGHRVHGLERKVVVCLEHYSFNVRLHLMSRCTSQLVIVSYPS